MQASGLSGTWCPTMYTHTTHCNKNQLQPSEHCLGRQRWQWWCLDALSQHEADWSHTRGLMRYTVLEDKCALNHTRCTRQTHIMLLNGLLQHCNPSTLRIVQVVACTSSLLLHVTTANIASTISAAVQICTTLDPVCLA